MVQPWRLTFTEESLKGYIFIVWECSTITSYVTMNPNMSIYRRLNPRLLVQAGMGLGLLHWANMSNIYIYIYIFNTLPQTQGGSSMKVWGWISMRRSLEDAMNKAFKKNHNEECANWPILEFQTKKWSSKLESKQKTEQDRPCRKFWLLVKGQRKKSKSTGPGSKSTDTGPGRF